MAERDQAKKTGDKSNYDRVTDLMKQAAGNIGFITFQYSPTLDFQQAQQTSNHDQAEIPTQETSKDGKSQDVLESAIEATETSTRTGSINQQVQNMKDIQRTQEEQNIDVARD